MTWKHSALTRQRKIEIYSAFIESRLLYGMSSLCLTAAQERKLNAFQSWCLRRVCKIQPAYYSRASNAERSFVRQGKRRLCNFWAGFSWNYLIVSWQLRRAILSGQHPSFQAPTGQSQISMCEDEADHTKSMCWKCWAERGWAVMGSYGSRSFDCGRLRAVRRMVPSIHPYMCIYICSCIYIYIYTYVDIYTCMLHIYTVHYILSIHAYIYIMCIWYVLCYIKSYGILLWYICVHIHVYIYIYIIYIYIYM